MENLSVKNGDDENRSGVLNKESECGVDGTAVSDGPLLVTMRK